MIDLFCDEVRRNPYPLYELARSTAPLLHEPRSGHWMVFDYDGVKRVLSDAETFSSRHGPADWMIVSGSSQGMSAVWITAWCSYGRTRRRPGRWRRGVRAVYRADAAPRSGSPPNPPSG